MRMLRFAAGFVAAITAGTLTAQQPPIFRLGTDLIQLDVMVGDKQGRHVSGLTKEDFEIYVSGKRVDASVLAENRDDQPASMSLTSARRDVASNETVQRDRIIMLVIDDVHIRRESTEAARVAASRFVAAIGGHAQVAVLFTSGKPGLEFTTDPQALLKAVEGFTGREGTFTGRGATMWPGGSTQMDPSRNRTGEAVRPVPNVQAQAGKDLLWSTMQQGLDTLPRGDGRRRAIVLISEGAVTASVNAAAAADPAAGFSIAGVPEKGLYSSRTPSGTERILGRFVQAIRTTGTSVYAIDPRGKATMGQEGYLGTDDFLNQDDVARQRQTSLRRYAEETGGFAVVDTSDVATGAARIAADLNNYYVLGLTPLNPKDTSLHTIEVRVKRPGLDVRHRRTYQMDTSRPIGAKTKDPLAALAASPLPNGELPLRVWATVVAPASPEAQARVVVWLESPTGPIAEYAVYPVDLATKKEVSPLARSMTGAVPSLIPIECPTLAPGTYQLRVVARSATAGGSAYLTVEIPAFTKVPLAISGLVIGEGADDRTDVAPLPFAPTLSREFAATSSLRVGFHVWQQAPGPVAATITILDASGREAERIARHAGSDDSRRVDAGVPLDRLAPGAYALTVTATNASHMTTASIAFTVR